MKVANPYKLGKRILNRSDKIFYRDIYDKFKVINNEIPVIKRAKGLYLYDFDGNRYVDFYMLGGNLLMGHVLPSFTKVIKSWFNRGYSIGYPFLQSNQMLVDRLGRIGDIYKDDDYLVAFFNSSSDALINALYILKLIGLSRGGFFTGHFVEKDFKLFDLKNATENYNKERYDYLIVKPTIPEIFDRINSIVITSKIKNTLIISDERDFPAIFYQLISNKWIDADIRVLGSWISSGYDFGAVIVKKSILLSFSKRNYNLLYYLDDFKFPPLYKIKGSIEFLNTIMKRGGIKSIAEMQKYFMEKIKNPYFVMRGGLIFVNIENMEDYSKFWFEMLRNGYFMPYNPELPVFISLDCNRELIARLIKDLNNLSYNL